LTFGKKKFYSFCAIKAQTPDKTLKRVHE